jgi:hypothetical protein
MNSLISSGEATCSFSKTKSPQIWSTARIPSGEHFIYILGRGIRRSYSLGLVEMQIAHHKSLILRFSPCISLVLSYNAVITGIVTDNAANLESGFNLTELRRSLTKFLGWPIHRINRDPHSTRLSLRNIDQISALFG